jgi:hypothetical protein
MTNDMTRIVTFPCRTGILINNSFTTSLRPGYFTTVADRHFSEYYRILYLNNILNVATNYYNIISDATFLSNTGPLCFLPTPSFSPGVATGRRICSYYIKINHDHFYMIKISHEHFQIIAISKMAKSKRNLREKLRRYLIMEDS